MVLPLLGDAQIVHLETFYRQHHPNLGELTLIHRPVLIDGSRDVSSRPPPELGEHDPDIIGG